MRGAYISEQEERDEVEEGVWELLVLLQRDPDLTQGEEENYRDM